jgi:hypothetical protein
MPGTFGKTSDSPKEETAAIAQGLREKAEEFRKSGGEIYRRA